MSLTYSSFLPLLSILLFTQTCLIASAKNTSYWEGTVYADLDGITPEKAFSYIADFCNVYKIYPVTVSFCVKGDPQNLIIGDRRFTGTFFNGTDVVQWEKHRLEKLDKVKMTLTYKTLADNIFIDYYRATLTVTEGEKGSSLMWHYILSPVGGFTPETAHLSIQDLAQAVATNIVNLAKST